MAREIKRDPNAVVVDDLVLHKLAYALLTTVDDVTIVLPHQRPEGLDSPTVQAWAKAIAVRTAGGPPGGLGTGQDTVKVVFEIEIAVYVDDVQPGPFGSGHDINDAYRAANAVRRQLTGLTAIDVNDTAGSAAFGDTHLLTLHRCDVESMIDDVARELVGLRVMVYGQGRRDRGRAGVDET